MRHTEYTEYVIITQWYDGAKVGSIWELERNPPRRITLANRYTVKTDTVLRYRYIGKDCGIVITKEENPEYFI